METKNMNTEEPKSGNLRCCICGQFNCVCPLEPVQVHVGPKPISHCAECGGHHEPSGARSDCIAFWKQRAICATELVEWARTLLCSVTPAKTLDESQSRQWCEGFGKWFAESHTIPVLSHDWGCAKQLYDWLNEHTYRTVVHRHNGIFVAGDDSVNKMAQADTLPLLCDYLLGWPKNAEPMPPTSYVKVTNF